MSNEAVGSWVVSNMRILGIVLASEKDNKIFCLVLAVIWAIGGALS